MTVLRFSGAYAVPPKNGITMLQWTFADDRPDRSGGLTLLAPCDLPTSILIESGNPLRNWIQDVTADGELTHEGFYITWQRTTGPDAGLAVTFNAVDQETTS